MMHRKVRGAMLAVAGVGMFFAGWAFGQGSFQTQKSTVHCVAWTAKDGMTPADLDRFKADLGKLPGMFPGLQRIWVGKLSRPITSGDATRDYGLAIEFTDMAAKQAYSDSARRDEWMQLFGTVRNPGSTSFDVVGE